MDSVLDDAVLTEVTADLGWTVHHPLERTLLLGSMLLLVLVAQSSIVAATVLVTTSLLAIGSSGVGVRLWLGTLVVPIGFLLPATLVFAIQTGVAESTLPVGLAWSTDGFERGAIVAVRALACAACTLLFILTTPVHIAAVAIRRAGIPPEICDTVLITARLVALLRARLTALSRTLAQRHGLVSWRARLRSVSLLGATLLVDALDRSARLERGLGGRGGLGSDAIARAAWRPLHHGRLWRAILVPVCVILVSVGLRAMLARSAMISP